MITNTEEMITYEVDKEEVFKVDKYFKTGEIRQVPSFSEDLVYTFLLKTTAAS